MPQIDLTIECAGWATALPDARGVVARAVRAALPAARPVSLNIVLSSDAAVRVLNRRWRGKNAPTNVLSFPSGTGAPAEPDASLGDVILAFQTVLREARRQGKPPRDHLAHLVVHGVLHLLGWDHATDREADVMEARERRVLARLGIADPYRPRMARAASV